MSHDPVTSSNVAKVFGVDVESLGDLTYERFKKKPLHFHKNMEMKI